MRGWMFLGQFAELRKEILARHDLLSLGDFDRGAFDEVPNELLAVVVSILRRNARPDTSSVALQPTRLDDNAYDRERTGRKRAATLAHVGRHEFDPRGFAVIEGEPIVYWWSKAFLARYAAAPKLGTRGRARGGANTGGNQRFTRRFWEVPARSVVLKRLPASARGSEGRWFPYILGGKDRCWIEPLLNVIRWDANGLAAKTNVVNRFGDGGLRWKICNEESYFQPGCAFSAIGAAFRARAQRFSSIIDMMGQSVYGIDPDDAVCFLNSRQARDVLESLNPSIHFQVADVHRLPWWPRVDAAIIFATVERAFSEHESHREASVEFRQPGPSAWTYAQTWAQSAVDCPEEGRRPAFEPAYEQPSGEAIVSFALGVALARFDPNGEGIVDATPATGLPSGLMFMSADGVDSLDHNACGPLRDAWREQGEAVGEGDDLRTYLRTSFFAYHKKLYENRPIYFPLSSARKNFVAFASIHRWQADTLNALLADHLVPTKRRLDGELDDLKAAKATGANKRQAERRFTEVQRLLEELNEFIGKVTEIAERGPPPPDDATTKREVDARYEMDLDDGVMVNSAALWPLLEPQWKDPKKWWRELANAKGKKDYDWSHLAARYFPSRVRKKCHEDPSLAVAHKCFWELYPTKAYAWELRLQDEFRLDFTIDEPGSDAARTQFLAENAQLAAELHATELKRRARKAAKADDSESGPLFGDNGEDEAPEGNDHDEAEE